MDPNTFPTKGNLILAKNSLSLSKMGYDLMDKKRNILIRELMALIDQAKANPVTDRPYLPGSYSALQKATWTTASTMCRRFPTPYPWSSPYGSKPEASWAWKSLWWKPSRRGTAPTYAFYTTRESMDKARIAFTKVKELTIQLSMVENSAYRWLCYQKDAEAG